MAKILLSQLPDAIANTLASVRDGLKNAEGDGISARLLEKVDFQAEIIFDVNSLDRTQVTEATGSTRTVSGGAETTTQTNGQGVTTTVESTVENANEFSLGMEAALERNTDSASDVNASLEISNEATVEVSSETTKTSEISNEATVEDAKDSQSSFSNGSEFAKEDTMEEGSASEDSTGSHESSGGANTENVYSTV